LEAFVLIISSIVSLIIFVLQLLMMARAILSWLPFDDDSALQRFLFVTTEPFIQPVRALLEKINFLSGFPIDLSFLVTYILLTLISSLLPNIYF
jgi:YggT family protein